MRELKTVGLDADGTHVICEAVGKAGDRVDKFKLRADDQLRAALTGDRTATHDETGQGQLDIEVSNTLTPKEIQSRIRAGASVEQVAAAASGDFARVERFAHPVLLERSRAAELATAAHPVMPDGPAVLTLREVVTTALVGRGLCPESNDWDAWRNEDGHWTVQLAWKAGRSDNVAYFRFIPGAYGGTVTAIDDEARLLIDPTFERPIRPLAPVAQLDFDEPAQAEPDTTAKVDSVADVDEAGEEVPDAETDTDTDTGAEPAPQPAARGRRGKPAVPAWEDVLLGVRSGGGQR